MNFAVLWTTAAEQDLAAIWLDARDRLRISEAAQRIDLRLQRDPASVGESREGDERLVIEQPLAATFEVRESHSHRLVVVKRVWRCDRRSK